METIKPQPVRPPVRRGLTLAEFAIARAFAQLDEKAKREPLTPQEAETIGVLADSVVRYQEREVMVR